MQAVTVGQTALTLALLMGAGLLLRTTSNLARVDSGYTTGQILNMTVTAVQGDWNAFHTRALERVAAISGVEGAAFAWGVPLTGNNWPGVFEFEGQPPVARPVDAVALPVRSVTPGYFATFFAWRSPKAGTSATRTFRRPDSATRAGDLSFVVAGRCLFKGSGGPHRGGPTHRRGRCSARAA